MHTEADYAPIVAQYIRTHSMAEWDTIFHHVENTLPLTEDDREALDSEDQPRWHRIIRNLKSNRGLTEQYTDIINVRNGFATAAFAKANGICEQTATNRGSKNPRGVRIKKITGKGENAIRAAWKHCFKDLKELYDNDILLADIRNPEMTAVGFGEKYNLTPPLV